MSNPTVITNPDGSTSTLAWAPPQTPPPPPVPPPSGTHTVVVSAADSAGVVWLASATVGEDWTVAGQYLPLVDPNANPHPGLRAKFYSDGVDIGSVNGADAVDYAGTLTVTYDGAVVFGPQTVQFWWGCFNKTLRYGPQAPWNPVDPTLFVHWAAGSPALPDFSKYDFSYNGQGAATYKDMGATGSRADIAYVPEWDIPFCVNPSDGAFGLVRQAADNSGAWPIYKFDDGTGLPFDITQYPATTFLRYSQETFQGNPIAEYMADKNKISGSPLSWDEAHETAYNFVAAAATGTARDRDHAAVWANAMLTALNPIWRQQFGVFRHYQERGNAWALRDLFLASYVSSMRSYFQNQLSVQLGIAGHFLNSNSFGILGSYRRPGLNGPNSGIAVWQENYTRIVTGVLANKIPAWQPFNAWLASFIPKILAGNTYPLSTMYVLTCWDSAGNFLQDMATMLCEGLQFGGWSQADAQAATAPGVTLQQVFDLMVAHGFKGKQGDLMQYDAAPDAYPALMRAAVACAVDAGAAPAYLWTLITSLPAQPDFSKEWGFNIVPRGGG